MYKAIRQTKKPCFAFKILAAGRIPDRGIEHAFRTAFASIKQTDGIYVGMIPRVRTKSGRTPRSCTAFWPLPRKTGKKYGHG